MFFVPILHQLWLWWLNFKPEPIFTTAPTASEFDGQYKNK